MEKTNQQELLARWCNGKLRGMMLDPSERVIRTDTLEGEIEASFGDWIIKGVKGEFYPCKPDIFDMTYEDVNMNNEIEILRTHLFELHNAALQLRNAQKAYMAS